jgi:malic enzyme
MQNVFGKGVLIHWEDFGSSNATRFLQRYRGMGPTFNDDIQSTAAVALASILGACRVDGVMPITEQVFMFVGAGQASLGIAALLVQALKDEVRPFPGYTLLHSHVVGARWTAQTAGAVCILVGSRLRLPIL